jgi:hypothetical protein
MMAQLRSMGLEGGPLWDAIENLRTDQAPPGSFVPEGEDRRILQVKIGLRVFWLGWIVEQDRGETVIRVMVVEES